MRLAIFGCIVLLGFIFVLSISFMLFLKENPSVAKKLHKAHGSPWKELLELALYERKIAGTLTTQDEEILDILLDDDEFDKCFNVPCMIKSNTDIKLRDMYLHCSRLILEVK